MPHYSEGFKEQIVRKMMPPNAQSVAQLSRDSGVSEQTLYNWRNQYRHEGKAVPADPSNPENWSGENKLAVVIETAALNEEQLSEYCRRKGLYPEQIARWKESAAAGTESSRPLTKAEIQELKRDRKKIRRLEKPFESIEAARKWVHRFVQWYNGEHRHSAIRYVTPEQRHKGQDIALLAARKRVYEAAKKRHPERWSGETRNWEVVSDVWLNPPKDLQAQTSCDKEAA